MGTNTVSQELGDAMLTSQDNLQRILESMVVLGEPHPEYERLMVVLTHLDVLASDLASQVLELEKQNATVVFGRFDAGTDKKNR